jgi:iduronate 2-sulfatase
LKLGYGALAAIGALLLPAAAQAPPDAGSRPSVLLLVLPSVGTRLGCYGPGPRTPNIDRLSRMGRRFTRAYVQYPSPSPSRVSLMLGLRPETTAIWGPPEPDRLDGSAPLQERFHAAGYRTLRVGAIYGGGAEAAQRWDVADVRRPAGTAAAVSPGQRVAALLAAHGDRPFFLAAALGESPPAGAPPPAPAPGASVTTLPALAVSQDPVERPGRVVHTEALSAEEKRVRLAALDARVAHLDAQVGLVLAALDRLALWDKVAVVLVSDEGEDLGDHGHLARRDLLFEGTLRTSLIFTLPGMPEPGIATETFAEIVDVYPTLLEICRLKKPEEMDGTSLAPVLQDPQASGKAAVFSAVARDAGHFGRSVRTSRYRYTEWPDGSEELYDHEADPAEWRNLALTPAAKPTLGDLRKLLDARDASSTPPPAAPPPERPPARRPNVLLIVADDLTVQLGSYGYPVKTPHIDRLASLGRRFERAYAQVPTCSPSRTSLMSGWRPERIDLWTNTVSPRAHLKGATPLQELFHANGYFTARVGKIYHGPWEDEFHWDQAEYVPPLPAGAAEREGESAREADRADSDREEGGGGASWWLATDGPDENEPDGRRARRVAELLAERRGRPFFIGLGLAKPHLRWIAPRKYFDLYTPEMIDVVEPPVDDLDDVPAIAIGRNTPMASPRLLATGRTPDIDVADRKRALAAYYACVSFVDAQLGVVFEAMDRLGLWKDTIVVLVGDHGFHLGEHGLWRKDTLFEAAVRAPLIVAAPQVRRPGIATDEVVEFLDIYPTLAELAGLPRPAGIQGQSLVPLLANPQAKGRGDAFSFRGCSPPLLGRSVRTGRYRFTEWPDGSQELYDLEADPRESTNLAADPRHAAALAEMKKRLDAGPAGGVSAPKRP